MLTGPGHDPQLVVRARRPAAQRDLPADRACDSRRSAGSREGRRGDDPDRRGALREGLPLRTCANGRPISTGRSSASASASSGVRDETQIHTHMCYSEFNDIIACDRRDGCRRDLDRDVALARWSCSMPSRSYRYPNEIGPGVYDIHSPRVPDVDGDDRAAQARPATSVGRPALGQSGLRPEDAQMGGGPPALDNMVAAARELRRCLQLRHCERSEAIHLPACCAMDCFVLALLAMTRFVPAFLIILIPQTMQSIMHRFRRRPSCQYSLPAFADKRTAPFPDAQISVRNADEIIGAISQPTKPYSPSAIPRTAPRSCR